MRIKKILYLGALIAILAFSYSLTRQIYDSLESGRRLDREAEELVALQQKNTELKKKLARTETVEFIEQQARNQLNMARPDEIIMVIPPEEIDKILGLSQDKPVEKIPYWQGWLKLFFK